MSEIHKMKSLLRRHAVGTVCESARCPNIGECFTSGEATFMILGNLCSRQCRFCSVEKGTPVLTDQDEPANVALATKEMGLKHVVITSVTRDDLEDGGASQFVATISKIRDLCPDITVEILVPDFNGNRDAIEMVLNARPDIFNHNLETVPGLYPDIRPKADYSRSLNILKAASESGLVTKSGLMVGLGETLEEVISVMEDLKAVGLDMITIGQYLAPAKGCADVKKFISDDEFSMIQDAGDKMGFKSVLAGPYVRSSYHAASAYKNVVKGARRP